MVAQALSLGSDARILGTFDVKAMVHIFNESNLSLKNLKFNHDHEYLEVF